MFWTALWAQLSEKLAGWSIVVNGGQWLEHHVSPWEESIRSLLSQRILLPCTSENSTTFCQARHAASIETASTAVGCGTRIRLPTLTAPNCPQWKSDVILQSPNPTKTEPATVVLTAPIANRNSFQNRKMHMLGEGFAVREEMEWESLVSERSGDILERGKTCLGLITIL